MNLNFLLNEEPVITLESTNTLALYFGIEPATEASGAGVVLTAIKEKVKGLSDKIKAFIAKVREWIKTKVYTFLKKETVSVNAAKYKIAMKINSEISKTSVNAITSFKLGMMVASGDNDKFPELSSNIEKFNVDLITIIDSSDYKSLTSGAFTGPSTLIKTDTINRDIKDLETILSVIERDLANNAISKSTTDPAIYSAIFKFNSYAMKKVNMQLRCLNAIMVGTQTVEPAK